MQGPAVIPGGRSNWRLLRAGDGGGCEFTGSHLPPGSAHVDRASDRDQEASEATARCAIVRVGRFALSSHPPLPFSVDSMNRKMGMRVGALVTSVAVAFGLGEAVTRVAVADPWNQDAVPNTVKQYDPELGWSLVPDSGGVSEATGRRVEYRINSHGFRGREYDFRKEPGVVLLGDSNTFGYGVLAREL